MPTKGPASGPAGAGGFIERMRGIGAERVARIHRLARRVWAEKGRTPADLQGRCREAWDAIGSTLGTRFRPLVPAPEGRPAANVILGSGGFSTGAHQVAQFREVARYAPRPPVELQGLVANRSEANGCNAAKVGREYGVPVVELDFADWYREAVDAGEKNPVAATRYWFPPGDAERPPAQEVARRFEVRQERFHGELGRRVAEALPGPTDIASLRGYSFALSSSVFRHQGAPPAANDTHPGDLTVVDPATGAKRYPGWQSGVVRLMMEDGLARFRGSLIQVEYMDRVAQIDELDEGALLAIGEGVRPEGPMAAKDVQGAMKLIDDDVFCTLEPAGLLLAWGISEDRVPVGFRDVAGRPATVRQRAIVVGDRLRSGADAWGGDLGRDLAELERFLCA